MDYKKIYHLIILKGKKRGLDKSGVDSYFELHHIEPRCFGGSDSQDNLVMLTAREHYIAHRLLHKIYPNSSPILLACLFMSNRTKKTTSRSYARLRELSMEYYSSDEFSKIMSRSKLGLMTSKNNSGAVGVYFRSKSSLWIAQVFKRSLGKPKNFILGKFKNKEDAIALRKAYDLSEDKDEFLRKIELSKDTDKKDKYWHLCDMVYEIWANSELVGKAHICEVIKSTGISCTAHSIQKMINLFKSGWIPRNDSEWVSWRDGINCD